MLLLVVLEGWGDKKGSSCKVEEEMAPVPTTTLMFIHMLRTYAAHMGAYLKIDGDDYPDAMAAMHRTTNVCDCGAHSTQHCLSALCSVMTVW